MFNNIFLSHADSESQSKDSGKQVLFYVSIFANKHIFWRKKKSAIAEFSPLVSSGIYEYETHFQVFCLSCQICGGPAAALVKVWEMVTCVLLLWQLKVTEVSGPSSRTKRLPHQYVLLVYFTHLFFSSLLLLEVFLPQEMPVEAHSTGFINDIFNCSSHSHF